MRPKVITQTVTGNSNPVVMDWRHQDFKVSLGLNITGSISGTVQHTLDDPADYTSISDYNTNADWYDHEEISAQSASIDGNYNYPVRAIRLNVPGASGGTAVLTVLQSG